MALMDNAFVLKTVKKYLYGNTMQYGSVTQIDTGRAATRRNSGEEIVRTLRTAVSVLSEEIRDIDFDIGCPRDGTISGWVLADGQRAARLILSDAYPMLSDLKAWMERCLVFDRFGALHPEVLTFEGKDTVYVSAMIHAGWEQTDGILEGHPQHEPIAIFILIRRNPDRPLLCCFCRPVRTIHRLYEAVRDAIRRYAVHYNNPRNWYDSERFNRLDPRTKAARMEDVFSSLLIENRYKRDG